MLLADLKLTFAEGAELVARVKEERDRRLQLVREYQTTPKLVDKRPILALHIFPVDELRKHGVVEVGERIGNFTSNFRYYKAMVNQFTNKEPELRLDHLGALLFERGSSETNVNSMIRLEYSGAIEYLESQAFLEESVRYQGLRPGWQLVHNKVAVALRKVLYTFGEFQKKLEITGPSFVCFSVCNGRSLFVENNQGNWAKVPLAPTVSFGCLADELIGPIALANLCDVGHQASVASNCESFLQSSIGYPVLGEGPSPQFIGALRAIS